MTEKDFEDLRRRAEGRLAPDEVHAMGRLVHELRVHQVELEMQNEELREAQQELGRSRDRYFELFDLAPVAYLTVDRGGALLEGNLAAAALLGVDRARLGRQHLDAFVSGAEGAHLARLLKALPEGERQGLELALRPRGGAGPRVVLIDALAARQDGREVVRVTLRDLTDRRRAEDELRRREAHLQTVLQTVVDAVITVGPDGRIETFSASAERIFGYGAGEARGRGFEILVPEAERAGCRALLGRLLRAGGPAGPGEILELAGLRRGGDTFPMEAGVGRIPGEAPRLVCVARDVSERRRREEALRHAQKMDSLGALAGGMAHDFNNLLSGISAGVALALRRLPDDHAAAEPLRRCADAIRRGKSITGQLLRFSARGEAKAEPIEIDALVGATAAFLQPLLGAPIRMEVRLDAPGARVLADPGELEQVLVNLGTNARDAMPEGGALTVRTELRAGPQPEGRPGVAIVVADTGQGMDEETRARIFEPFFSTKGRGQGTGLGLATAHTVVSRLGGRISVESEPGRGATFTLWLPLLEPAPAAAADPPG